MLMTMKSLNLTQQIVSMHQNNLSPLYCSYIYQLLSNILLFSAALSLEHELPNIFEGEFYTL